MNNVSEHLMPVQPGWTVELRSADGVACDTWPLVAWLKDNEGIWPCIWVTGQGLTTITEAHDLRPDPLRA